MLKGEEKLAFLINIDLWVSMETSVQGHSGFYTFTLSFSHFHKLFTLFTQSELLGQNMSQSYHVGCL